MLRANMRPYSTASLGKRSAFLDSKAFTLVEVAVVAVIIGLLAALAIPGFKRSVMAAKSDAVINDLRVFSGAFQHYMQEKGDWPEDSPAGEYPPSMEQYLRTTTWTSKSPIGGHYNWDSQVTHNGSKVRAAISINSVGDNAVTSDRLQLEDIDKRLDDGDLSTGSFRLGFDQEPLFIIEP